MYRHRSSKRVMENKNVKERIIDILCFWHNRTINTGLEFENAFCHLWDQALISLQILLKVVATIAFQQDSFQFPPKDNFLRHILSLTLQEANVFSKQLEMFGGFFPPLFILIVSRLILYGKSNEPNQMFCTYLSGVVQLFCTVWTYDSVYFLKIGRISQECVKSIFLLVGAGPDCCGLCNL